MDISPLDRARWSLEGLAVGDSFGERFFVSNDIEEYLIANRAIPAGERSHEEAAAKQPVWPYTDDTLMALSVFASLARFGDIDQDWLAKDFARRYDSSRGYGPAMHSYLARLREGEDWREAAPSLFGGSGSFGNGAAMRVAPIGAYFANDMDAVVENAVRSAEVTHAHPEAVAGAIAVAAAAAIASRARAEPGPPTFHGFLDRILPFVAEGEVRNGMLRARQIGPEASMRLAVPALGNGVRVTAQDTVPFAIWCAARHLGDFEEALWTTVSGLGDRDTTCAIVGGIVAAYTGPDAIPADWRTSREPLPPWAFGEE